MSENMNGSANGQHDGDDGAVGENGLTPRQEQAVAALLAEPNIKRAADSIRLPERTLHRWLKQPAFKRAFRDARREASAQAVAMVVHYAPMAVQTLAKVMADASAPHAAKVSASLGMLRSGRDSVELDDLASRVEELERSAKERGEDDEPWRGQR